MTRIIIENERGSEILWTRGRGVDQTKDPRVLRVVEDIKERSITPDSFEKRVFDSSIEGDLYYIDHFKCGSDSGLRYGINKFFKGVAKIIEQDGVDIELFQPKDQPKDQSKDQGGLSRGASEKSVSGQHHNFRSQGTKTICTIEKSVLKKAITYLKSNEDIMSVAVDILDRKGDNVLFTSDGSLPKVHTVVLVKNGKTDRNIDKFFLIDPNNSKFSNHFYGFEDGLGNGEEFAIETLPVSKKIKIYKPDPSNIGFAHDQYRDCANIAVILSALINKEMSNSSGQNLDPMSLKSISLVSNQNLIDNTIPTNEVFSCRIKQSSNLEILYKFNKWQQNVFRLIKTFIQNDIQLAALSGNSSKFGDCAKKKWVEIVKQINLQGTCDIAGAIKEYNSFYAESMKERQVLLAEARQKSDQDISEILQQIEEDASEEKACRAESYGSSIASDEGLVDSMQTSIIGGVQSQSVKSQNSEDQSD